MYALFKMGAPAILRPRIATYTCRYTYQYSQKYVRDTPLLLATPLAIMHLERRFTHTRRPNATYDYGIMQLHCPDKKYAWWCRQCDIRKLRCNIKQGIKYLARTKAKCLRTHTHKSHWTRHYNWHSKKKIRGRWITYDQKFLKVQRKAQRFILEAVNKGLTSRGR
jgi:hypothetical protein